MTTCTSMAHLLLDRPKAPTQERSAVSVVSPTASAGLINLRTLPYCASHQAEFLYLQAETEALLRQLQTLQQRRASMN